MSSEGLPITNVVGTDVELSARNVQGASNAASSSQSADSAATSADAAFKFSRNAKDAALQSQDYTGQAAAAAEAAANASATAYEDSKQAIDEAIRQSGFAPLDSFEQGANLTLVSQALRWEANNAFYSWRGLYPKQVPFGSTPETTGGFAQDAWVDVSDLTLRTQLLSPEGGENVYVTPPELTAPRVLSDYFSDNVNLLNVDGFKGDGSDEKDVIQWAINKAAEKRVNLIIPTGKVAAFTSINIPTGTSIEVKGTFKSLAEESIKFIDSGFYESNITSSSVKGDTTLTVENGSGFYANQLVAVKYYYDTSDAYYNEIAQDPTLMGYQRQVIRISSAFGNQITFGARLLYSITPGSTLSSITESETNISMGISGSIVADNLGYLINQWNSRVIIDGGIIDFVNKSKGIRFNGSHLNAFRNVRMINSLGGNTLMLAYGSCLNVVTGCNFIGQQNGDSQLCLYAGGYGNTSAYNHYINGDNANSRGAIMFGAKSWGNNSIGDSIDGGFYGASCFFGAQRNVFRDLTATSQMYAGVFIEDSQDILIDNAVVTYPRSNPGVGSVAGAVVLKATDSVQIRGGSIQTNGANCITMYDDAGVQKQRNGLIIQDLKTEGGSVSISHAIKNMQLVLKMNNGSWSHYYAYDIASTGEVNLTVKNGSVRLSAVTHGKITVDVDCNGVYQNGLILGGYCRYSTVVNSRVSNATGDAYNMESTFAQGTTSLCPESNLSFNCGGFITNGVTDTATPSQPSTALPPAGFFLPVNSWNRSIARARLGYRAKGNSDTTYKQWLIVQSNEVIQS